MGNAYEVKHETGLAGDSQRVFYRAFDSEARRQLIEEDRLAWRNVCGVLLMIVSGGLLLGITAVLISTR
jgi:hypothetical protein